MKKILTIILLTFLFTSGCEEIELVGFPGNEEEIRRYVTDDDLGHDFFRVDSIILSTPYEYPLDTGAIYFDQLLSTTRSVDVSIPTDESSDFLYAYVTVIDNFVYTSTRIKGIDTTVYNRSTQFKRFGYFEKLGDSSQRFSGWLLRGFSGGTSVSGLFHADNTVFYDGGNYYRDMPEGKRSQKYIALTGSDSVVERLDDGEMLKAQMFPSDESFIQILSTETQNGFIFQQFLPDSLLHSTIQFTTPPNRHQTWGIIVFREHLRSLTDSSLIPAFDHLSVKFWCEPFRVD